MFSIGGVGRTGPAVVVEGVHDAEPDVEVGQHRDAAHPLADVR
jgi:hypothetical protein